MNLNLEPIGLPNVPPTTGQRWAGHLTVIVVFALVVHAIRKKDPGVAVVAGALAGVVHQAFDAPVSQVIAGVAAS
jgi:hypothetical protein